jgi:hypothetical protein
LRRGRGHDSRQRRCIHFTHDCAQERLTLFFVFRIDATSQGEQVTTRQAVSARSPVVVHFVA